MYEPKARQLVIMIVCVNATTYLPYNPYGIHRPLTARPIEPNRYPFIHSFIHDFIQPGSFTEPSPTLQRTQG